jgi:hypothetical protein
MEDVGWKMLDGRCWMEDVGWKMLDGRSQMGDFRVILPIFNLKSST